MTTLRRIIQQSASTGRPIPPKFLNVSLSSNHPPQLLPLSKKRRRSGDERDKEKRKIKEEKDGEGSDDEENESSDGEGGTGRGYHDKNDYVCLICEKDGDLLLCDGPCLSSFHIKCLGLKDLPDDEQWFCNDCKNGSHRCFYCHNPGTIVSPKKSLTASLTKKEEDNTLRKCSAISCGKFYHMRCVESLPLTRMVGSQFICPLHTCAMMCQESGKTRKSVRCTRCPTAYHTKCLPKKGIRRIMGKRILCGKCANQSSSISNSNTKNNNHLGKHYLSTSEAAADTAAFQPDQKKLKQRSPEEILTSDAKAELLPLQPSKERVLSLEEKIKKEWLASKTIKDILGQSSEEEEIEKDSKVEAGRKEENELMKKEVTPKQDVKHDIKDRSQSRSPSSSREIDKERMLQLKKEKKKKKKKKKKKRRERSESQETLTNEKTQKYEISHPAVVEAAFGVGGVKTGVDSGVGVGVDSITQLSFSTDGLASQDVLSLKDHENDAYVGSATKSDEVVIVKGDKDETKTILEENKLKNDPDNASTSNEKKALHSTLTSCDAITKQTQVMENESTICLSLNSDNATNNVLDVLQKEPAKEKSAKSETAAVLETSFHSSLIQKNEVKVKERKQMKECESDVNVAQETALSGTSIIHPSALRCQEKEREEAQVADAKVKVQTNAQIDVQKDVQTDVQVDLQASVQTGVQTEVQADVQTGVQADDQTDAQTVIQTVIQTDAQTVVQTLVQTDVVQADVVPTDLQDGVQGDAPANVASLSFPLGFVSTPPPMSRETEPSDDSTFSLLQAQPIRASRAAASAANSKLMTRTLQKDKSVTGLPPAISAAAAASVDMTTNQVEGSGATSTSKGKADKKALATSHASKKLSRTAVVSNGYVNTNDQEERMEVEKKTLDNVTEEDDEEDDHLPWVQCDNCKKWRTVAAFVDLEMLSDQWFCHMNTWDKRYASCDAPEEDSKSSPTKSPSKASKTLTNSSSATNVGAGVGLAISSSSGEKKKDEKQRGIDGHTNKAVKEKSKKRKLKELQWVQCDRCDKWRSAPISVDLNKLPESWQCESNTWNRSVAHCSIPNSPDEQTYLKKRSTSSTKNHNKKAKLGSDLHRATTLDTNRNSNKSSDVHHLVKVVKAKEDVTNSSLNGKGKKEKQVWQWVQCEKCEQWRKLPTHIDISSLPEKWFCSMNKWDPQRASCSIKQEDDQDSDSGFKEGHSHLVWTNFGVTRKDKGKISYRQLLFGSNGLIRKAYTDDNENSFERNGSVIRRDDQYRNTSSYCAPKKKNKRQKETDLKSYEATDEVPLTAEQEAELSTLILRRLSCQASTVMELCVALQCERTSFRRYPFPVHSNTSTFSSTSTSTLNGSRSGSNTSTTQIPLWSVHGTQKERIYYPFAAIAHAVDVLTESGQLERVVPPKLSRKDRKKQQYADGGLSMGPGRLEEDTEPMYQKAGARPWKVAKPWKTAAKKEMINTA